MVVSIRELVNILFSTSFTALQPIPIAQLLSNIDMNMDIDMIREISAFSSQISFKESSTYSAILSTLYHERIEI